MHRNTVLIIIVLTVIASLLVGINVGKRLSGELPQLPIASPQVLVVTSPSPLATPLPQPVAFELKDCGVAFTYQNDFTLTEASRGAQLTRQHTATPGAQMTLEQINVACSEEIPRPPLKKDRIEVATVAGLTVNLYHDASAKDGTPLDAVIFTHPKNGLDIAILGFGTAFNRLLQTLKLLP